MERKHELALELEAEIQPQFDKMAEHSALRYWKSYFDFSFYIGLVPYKLSLNRESGQWEMCTNRWQKSLALILLAIFTNILRVKYFSGHSSPTLSSITFYIILFENALLLLYVVNFYYTMWFESGSILAVFNWIQQNLPEEELKTALCSSSRDTLYRRLAKALPVLFVSLAFVTQFENIPNFDLTLFESLAQDIFLLNHPGTKSPALNLLAFIIIVYLDILLFSVDCLFIMTIFFYRRLVHHFVEEFEVRNPTYSSDVELRSVFSAYQQLKHAVILINNACGLIHLTFIYGCMPFLTELVAAAPELHKKNVFTIVRLVALLVYFTWGLSALGASHAKIGKLYNWLTAGAAYGNRDHNGQSSSSQRFFHILMNDLRQDNISLSMNGMSITFGLLGSMIGMILTYLFLFLQFQDPNAVSIFEEKNSNTEFIW